MFIVMCFILLQSGSHPPLQVAAILKWDYLKSASDADNSKVTLGTPTKRICCRLRQTSTFGTPSKRLRCRLKQYHIGNTSIAPLRQARANIQWEHLQRSFTAGCNNLTLETPPKCLLIGIAENRRK